MIGGARLLHGDQGLVFVWIFEPPALPKIRRNIMGGHGRTTILMERGPIVLAGDVEPVNHEESVGCLESWVDDLSSWRSAVQPNFLKITTSRNHPN